MTNAPQCRREHERPELSAAARQQLAALRPSVTIGGKSGCRLCVHCGYVEPLEASPLPVGKRSDWLLLRPSREGLVLAYLALLLVVIVLLAAYNAAKGNGPDAWEALAVAGLLVAGWVVATCIAIRWLRLLKTLTLPEPVANAVAKRWRALVAQSVVLVLTVLSGVALGHHLSFLF